MVTKTTNHVCPSCGRCSCCGRGGYYPWPVYPYTQPYWYYDPYRYYNGTSVQITTPTVSPNTSNITVRA